MKLSIFSSLKWCQNPLLILCPWYCQCPLSILSTHPEIRRQTHKSSPFVCFLQVETKWMESKVSFCRFATLHKLQLKILDLCKSASECVGQLFCGGIERAHAKVFFHLICTKLTLELRAEPPCVSTEGNCVNAPEEKPIIRIKWPETAFAFVRKPEKVHCNYSDFAWEDPEAGKLLC